jgi:parallel beta-helix repeat protein
MDVRWVSEMKMGLSDCVMGHVEGRHFPSGLQRSLVTRLILRKALRRNVKGDSCTVALVVVLLLLSFLPLVSLPEVASAHTPHDPIYIEGNLNFTAANGVVGGSGAWNDPFIIEGWEIDATAGFFGGITIVDTDAHFVVRDVYVHSGGWLMMCDGIAFYNVRNGRVEDSTLSNNTRGIGLYYSVNITITGNIFINDGIHLWGEDTSHFNSHTITADNLVEGLPIHYFKDHADLVIDGIPAGQLLIVNSTHVLIANMTLANTDSGVEVALVDQIVFTGNRISNCFPGIFLLSTSNANITGNELLNNNVGVFSVYSDDVQMMTNQMHSNINQAIQIDYSTNTTIVENDIWNNTRGIHMYYSNETVIADNTIHWNDGHGIRIDHGFNSTVTGNVAEHNDYNGIYLHYSTDAIVARNNVSYNIHGISIGQSTNVSIIANNVIANEIYGIPLVLDVGTIIHHNNIINNGLQAKDDMASENTWDDGYPSGGNFWSDYSGIDQFSGPDQNLPGSDGIGDTPYVIDADSQDRYPLMSPVIKIPPAEPTINDAYLSGNAAESVTIKWSLSQDDGGGMQSVVAYDIRRGTIHDLEGTGYQLFASVPNGTSAFTDSLAGEGDPSNYFYQVCARDAFANIACSKNQAGKFTRPVSRGPNLVSIPLRQSIEDVGTVLQTVEYDRAWFYDSSNKEWKWYMTFKNYRRGFWILNHKIGLWVNVTEDSNLTLAGIVPAQTTIHLYEGWNLISFPSFNSITIADVKAEIGVIKVEGYDSSPPHYLRVLGDGETLQAGYGYWMKLESDTDWVVEVS